MAVTLVQEIWDRSGDVTLEFDRHYTRTFEVYTNDNYDEPVIAMQAVTSLVPLGTPYATVNASDFGSVATRVSAQATDHPRKWVVSLEYESKADDPDQQAEDPTARPPIYKITYNRGKKIMTQDAASADVVNSAEDPFDPPIEIDDSRPVIQVSWYLAATGPTAFDFSLTQTLKDAVNSDTWNNFTAGKCKVAGLEAQEVYENNDRYWQMSATVELADAWNTLDILDQGYRDINGDVFKDGEGMPKSTPTLLDGAGAALAKGQPAEFVTFQPYLTTTFVDKIPEWQA